MADGRAKPVADEEGRKEGKIAGREREPTPRLVPPIATQ